MPSRNSRSVSLEEAHNQALSWNKRLEENYIMAMKQIDALNSRIRDLKTELKRAQNETAQTKMWAEIKDDLYESLLAQSRSEMMDKQVRIDDLCAELRSEFNLQQDNRE